MTAGCSRHQVGSISGGLVIALELTGMSLSITRGGPMLYMPRICISLVSNCDVLMNAQCSHKWWSTLKSAVFGSSLDSSLPLIGVGGGLVCESVVKADMLLAHFDGKQSRESICHPSPSLTTFASGHR